MPDLADAACADVPQTRLVLEQIANKWSVLILTVLCPKPARFNEIKRRVSGITHKALADALKRLERSGLVERHVLPTSPVGVEYTITPLGHSLRQPFEALCAWTATHGPSLIRAQLAYDGRGKDPSLPAPTGHWAGVPAAAR